jgi:hypothetical protein
MLSPTHHRTKCIGVRVREADFARLQALADAEGKSLGEWCRDNLLERAANRKPNHTEQAAVLSEILALRTIHLNVLFALAKGKDITEEEMNDLIERADAEKSRRAIERLNQFGADGRGPVK